MGSNVANDHQNRLAAETSPYLLQHANNPVDWYPWGEEAMQKAKEEDKMLLVSIGYSACHWCHVMEHESFEDEEVARVMNENFVCIKVDREERPDVDQVYMNAVQLLTGSGGWPLNCFALPDGSPVYGGTYFPKDNWVQVLHYIAGIYRGEREKATQQAEALKQGIGQSEHVQFKATHREFSTKELDNFYSSFVTNFDQKNGGFGSAPKFPMPTNWLFLLRYYHVGGNKEALEQTLLSLDRIANGGIYDHIGGGFARYATNAQWNIPHFEKMLYDNGQLLSLYSEAYQLTRNDKYKAVVYETIEFISRELTAPEGVFYSSLDADSEGEEGKFYVWTKQDLDDLLGKDAELFCDYYNCSASGNWEHGKNNLFITRSIEQFATRYKLKPTEVQEKLNKSKKILLEKRSERTRPGLDDKILTSWNALMIKGLTDAYRVFGENEFLDKALKASNFILTHQKGKDYSLMRNHKEGRSTIPAFLDDYALVIDAFINLYKATFDEQWLQHADAFTAYTLSHFYDTTISMFYYTNIEFSNLVVRKMELSDNVIPSSNSVMANNLYKLGIYLGNMKYSEISNQMLTNVLQDMLQHPRYYSNWGILLVNKVDNPVELAISGPQAEERRKELEQHYFPELILAGANSESKLPLLLNRFENKKTRLFVCQNYTCKLPVETIEEALELFP